MRLDLHHFFKQLRRPASFASKLSRLKNHDFLSLGAITFEEAGKTYYCQALIRKVSGHHFQLQALWTLPTKPSRPSSSVLTDVTIRRHGQVEIVDLNSYNQFKRICVWIGHLINTTRWKNYTADWRSEDLQRWYENDWIRQGLPYCYFGLIVDKFNKTEDLLLRYTFIEETLFHHPGRRVNIQLDEEWLDRIAIDRTKVYLASVA